MTNQVNLFELQTIAERESKEAETEQERNAWANALKSVEEHIEFFEEYIPISWILGDWIIRIDNDKRPDVHKMLTAWRTEHDHH